MIKLAITHDDKTAEIHTACPEYDVALVGLLAYGMEFIQEAQDMYSEATGRDLTTYSWYVHVYQEVERALTEVGLGHLLERTAG